MPTTSDVAELVLAISGLVSAVAGLVTAFRRDQRGGEVSGADSAPSGGDRRAAPESRRAGEADWTAAGYGALALTMALALVLLSRNVHAPDGQTHLTLLRFGVAIPFALAVYFGVRGVHGATVNHRPDLLVSAGTGLVAAVGAMTAMLIAGSGPNPAGL